jgi:hypothetical protein
MNTLQEVLLMVGWAVVGIVIFFMALILFAAVCQGLANLYRWWNREEDPRCWVPPSQRYLTELARDKKSRRKRVNHKRKQAAKDRRKRA